MCEYATPEEREVRSARTRPAIELPKATEDGKGCGFNGNPVELLIADDHELIRIGLIRILANSHPEWRVVADVPTGTAAIELGVALRPAVAILDLSMPDIGGLQVAERLQELVPGIRIVILSMYAAAPILRHLRKAGVSACVAKNEAPEALVHAVERVLAGEHFFASSGAARQTVGAPGDIPVQFLLTPRELDVLQLLARGKSNKELAAELGMSVRTAETHRANIMAKLNIKSLANLMRIAFRDGVT
jgi:DNA-binding NarL/FixJ family response regulator